MASSQTHISNRNVAVPLFPQDENNIAEARRKAEIARKAAEDARKAAEDAKKAEDATRALKDALKAAEEGKKAAEDTLKSIEADKLGYNDLSSLYHKSWVTFTDSRGKMLLVAQHNDEPATRIWLADKVIEFKDPKIFVLEEAVWRLEKEGTGPQAGWSIRLATNGRFLGPSVEGSTGLRWTEPDQKKSALEKQLWYIDSRNTNAAGMVHIRAATKGYEPSATERSYITPDNRDPPLTCDSPGTRPRATDEATKQRQLWQIQIVERPKDGFRWSGFVD